MHALASFIIGSHTSPTRSSLPDTFRPPQGDRKGPHPTLHHSRPYKTLLANAIERRFPSSSRATTRVAPTMDGPGEPLPTWHGRGDPRGRPAGSLHALVPLYSHCHSPAKSYYDTMPCDTPLVFIV